MILLITIILITESCDNYIIYVIKKKSMKN